MEERKCTCCGEKFPPTTEYFHKSKTCVGGLNTQCKICVNKKFKENWKRKKYIRQSQAPKTPAWTKEQEQYLIDNHGKITYREMAENLGKELNQVTAKMQQLDRKDLVNRSRYKQGFSKEDCLYSEDLKININVGDRCSMSFRINERSKNKKSKKGVVIQKTKDHITIKFDKGYCESFLKVDLIIGEYQIRRI